ncbi:hypothetical protein VDG1235_3149 [Verrucomicrobiia bacterium DG1235]|nr:hypothetical protein VDG1235_3149 [Verrucomicrobiae bacterium DG1235]
MTDQTNKHSQEELFFGDRFWEQYLGKRIVTDPITALVELVANAWDAGAKEVKIDWSADESGEIAVSDNGGGMTEDEFNQRWRDMSYDRIMNQGSTVDVNVDGTNRKRQVFGKNGIGRFAAFCFASEYRVKTSKNTRSHTFLVKKGRKQAIEIDLLNSGDTDESGTTISVQQTAGSILRDETIRSELGRRFLIDPAFRVSVNGVYIDFEDIKDDGMEIRKVKIQELDTEVTIRIIDSQRTDRTVRQHGVAWHVNGRLVGDCDWKDPEQRSLVDGRRVEAKRFTFIVEADVLNGTKAVKPDWSGFDESVEAFTLVNDRVQPVITNHLLEVTKEKRTETTNNVRSSFSRETKEMSPLRRERWTSFVEQVAAECPSLSENELKSVSGVLAKMELADSKYGLLHKLHQLNPDQIDDLHQILEEWTVDMAKVVLDEIRNRLKLIEELRAKTEDDSTLEVQELQPLFRQGLWIFGPEFETIHYTSNEGMTSVIQNLFGKKDLKGSRNRPDFAILPDSSAGFYSYSEYDEEGGEIGIEKLVVLELKAPKVPLGDDEKQQCWKYIRELNSKGLLTDRTEVRGYVLGKHVNQADRDESTHLNGRVRIRPIPFSTVLQRADSRLLKLRDKIKSAPFLHDAKIDEFLDENPNRTLALDNGSGTKEKHKATA